MQDCDVDAVLQIESQTLSSWSGSSVRSELQRSTRSVFVAEDDHLGMRQIVGWYSASSTPPEAELLKIAVKSNKRRQGVGSGLLEHLFSELVGEGIEDLFLEVRSQNISALTLYIKMGFVEVGCRLAYYPEPIDDALILVKKIE